MLLPQNVFAQVTTVQALDFGEFISKNNDSQHDITVNVGSGYSFDSAGYIEIVAPQKGIYTIGGFTPFDTVTSVVVTENTPVNAGVQLFNLVNMTDTHPVSTDVNGDLTINIGGTLRSTGNGTPYNDQSYTGSIDIQVNF